MDSWGPPNSDEDSNHSAFEDSDDQTPNNTGLSVFGPPVINNNNKSFGDMGIGSFPSQAHAGGNTLQSGQALVNGRAVSLIVLRQPEEQHRARYMSEGSRGAIKGKNGKGHCSIQLVGYNRPTRVDVYASAENNPLTPHPLYRVIPVTGKGGGTQTTPCEERITPEGFNAVSVLLRPEFKMTALLDCIGILKICSHDTKKRIPKSNKNTTIKLVFRAVITQKQGEDITIQTLSSPISCTQQLGHPEIQKVSSSSATVKGGTELFILGKNFDKNIRVVFREYDTDGNLVWISDGVLERKHLHQCHLVCRVPTYRDQNVTSPVEVTMTLECGKKTGHPQTFLFHPEKESIPVAHASPTCTLEHVNTTFNYSAELTPLPSQLHIPQPQQPSQIIQEKWRPPNLEIKDQSLLRPAIDPSHLAGQVQSVTQNSNTVVGYFPAPVSEFLTQTTPSLSSIFQILEPTPQSGMTDFRAHPIAGLTSETGGVQSSVLAYTPFTTASSAQAQQQQQIQDNTLGNGVGPTEEFCPPESKRQRPATEYSTGDWSTTLE
jgi:nuclear factor of activated T-cells 5